MPLETPSLSVVTAIPLLRFVAVWQKRTSKVMETEKLLHFAERGSMLAEFDDLLFTKFVDSVRVDSRQQVSFVLKCGLTFKERIGE